MKKIILFILPFFLTGCITYTELNELEVVNTLALDYYDNQYHLIASLVEKKDQETIIKTQESNGKTIEEAVINMKIKENKKLYIAHLNLLLLTPSIINEKLEETLDYFLSKKESRNDFQVALTNDITFLKKEDNNQLSKTINIIEEDTATTRSIILEDFIKDLLEKNTTYLPYIQNSKEQTTINGVVLMNKNKMIYLEKEETILWNMIHQKLKKATIEPYQILSTNTSLTYKNKKMLIRITSTLEEEKKNFENVITEKINEMFNKYQKQDFDVFNFQQIINNKNEKSNTSYQDLTLDIKLTIKNNKKTNTR